VDGRNKSGHDGKNVRCLLGHSCDVTIQLATLISIRVNSSGAITMASWPVAISAQLQPCCALTQLREACSAA
jgi:hypothetical protein